MFCKVRVCKGDFCNWLRKNWPTLTTSPHWTITKYWIPPLFLFPVLEFQNKFNPLTCLVWNLGSPIYEGWGRGEEESMTPYWKEERGASASQTHYLLRLLALADNVKSLYFDPRNLFQIILKRQNLLQSLKTKWEQEATQKCQWHVDFAKTKCWLRKIQRKNHLFIPIYCNGQYL